jgi:hypothetical protein
MYCRHFEMTSQPQPVVEGRWPPVRPWGPLLLVLDGRLDPCHHVRSTCRDEVVGTRLHALRGPPRERRRGIGGGVTPSPMRHHQRLSRAPDLARVANSPTEVLSVFFLYFSGWRAGWNEWSSPSRGSYFQATIASGSDGDHGGEYYTVYAHAADIRVTEGDEVKQGQIIGTVGATGSLRGPRLYFEVRHEGKPQDPSQWLSEARPKASRANPK